MAIGDLGAKVNRADREKMDNLRNKEYEDGFEPTQSDSMEFDDFSFDDFNGGETNAQSGNSDLDDIFGSSPSIFGDSNSFSDQSNRNTQPTKTKTDEVLDEFIEYSAKSTKHAFNVVKELVTSIRTRTADDFAYLSRNLIITGASFMGTGIVLSLVGVVSGMKLFRITGLSGNLLCTGILSIGSGLMGMGFSAIMVAKLSKEGNKYPVENMQDTTEIEDNSFNEYEDSLDSLLGGLEVDDEYGDEDLFGLGETTESDDMFKYNMDNQEEEDEHIDTKETINFENELEQIPEGRLITRELLLDTFKNLLPLNTQGFSDVENISSSDDRFVNIENIALKALANVAKRSIDEVNSSLEELKETYFSYELRMTRIMGVNKLDAIETEMEAYFRSSSDDLSVTAKAVIEGDFYKITITKGVTPIVTLGDALQLEHVYEFYRDNSNKLPMIVGIDELGNVLLEDAKVLDTMLIAGKQRSGKSWYVLSLMMSMLMFNSPEDVQCVIVDPKSSFLFKQIALMPHVVGLHGVSDILSVMRELVEVEGARRKKLLEDNRCDDIWALQKKGIKLPVLFFIVDEVMTVVEELGAMSSDFQSLLKVMISQLPSLGIKIIVVPHRAQGVVDKTNRTLISLACAVKLDNASVDEALEIKGWKKPLVNKGDAAVKFDKAPKGKYVRGVAVTTEDSTNTELIETVAKAFYKMGVEIPDMSYLHVTCNRDEDAVKDLLLGKNIQYSASNVFNEE